LFGVFAVISSNAGKLWKRLELFTGFSSLIAIVV
jgi:hypothetical protein